MSGPIVRSGGSEQYANNWARAFGQKAKKSTTSQSSKKKTTKKKKKSK